MRAVLLCLRSTSDFTDFSGTCCLRSLITIRLSVATPTMMSYSEYLSTVASPASVNVIEVHPIKGALILIHPRRYSAALITGTEARRDLLALVKREASPRMRVR